MGRIRSEIAGIYKMTDENIVALYWDRNEQALDETKAKYEHYLLKIAHNVLADYEDSKGSYVASAGL